MSRRINAILVHDETVDPDLVRAHIPEGSGIEITEVFGTLRPSAEAIRRADTDLILVACREGSADALALLEWWQTIPGSRPALLLSYGTDQAFIQRAFSAGADDIVVLHPGPYVPEQNQREVEFAIRKAVARNYGGSERPGDTGTLVCILGSKGGVGKTLVAANVGVALAQRGRRTALVDLDLQFGDVALALGLAPETTLFDLAVSGGSLDAEKLDDFMLRHSSGLRVLAAPARPDHAASVTAGMIADVYTLLRQEYEFVIVDTPPSFTPEVITTIDVATWVCMVGMLDALSVKNTRLGLETLNLMNYPVEHVLVALNRANTNVGLSQKDAVTLLGRVPDVLIPSDREVTRSINEGVPVVLSSKRSDAGRALNALADLLISAQEEQSVPALGTSRRTARSKRERRGKRSLFGRRESAAVAPGLARES
jgi:pilus assembly protein CpaE